MRARRAALVTGASSGIGRAVAEALARDGYAVTMCARRPGPLEEVASGLAQEGLEAAPVACDLSDADAACSVVGRHEEAFGRLDVLISNAGYGGPVGPAEALATDRLDRLLAVNLTAPAALIEAAAPMLRSAAAEHGQALVAATASIAAAKGQPDIAAYSAAKAALRGLMRAVRKDLAPGGVQVTTLMPALVATAMSEWMSTPAEQMMRPEDLAETVRFLLRTSPACHVPEVMLVRPTSDV